MNYNQLSIEERHAIDILFNIRKESITRIANVLSRSKSTISREIKRNSQNGYYFFKDAQENSVKRNLNKYKFRQMKYLEFSILFKKHYDSKFHGVKATWQKITSENTNLKSISWVWIFKLIKSDCWVVIKKDRLRRYYKKGRKRKIGIFTKFRNKRVKPIWVRPKYIDLREEFGHWEVDLVIGKKASGYANLITFTERKTRLNYIKKTYSKNPMKVNSDIYKIIKENNLDVKTITVDNGIEFGKIGLLAHWVDCDVYYCEPYASYQRGTNENTNGLIRRQYKKGTNFSDVSDEDIFVLQEKINDMPREIFGWISSNAISK